MASIPSSSPSPSASSWSLPSSPATLPPSQLDPPVDPVDNDIAAHNLRMLVDELCRQPTASDIVQSARAWTMQTWSTEDGSRFYLRDTTTRRALKSMPTYTRAEVAFLTEDHAKLCANRCMDYHYFKQKVMVIYVGNLSNEDKLSRIHKLSETDPLCGWWVKATEMDGQGRIVRFVWRSPSSRSQRLTFDATSNIQLQNSPSAPLYHSFNFDEL